MILSEINNRELRNSRHAEFIPGEEQETLSRARILMAGVGAGSTLAPNLARIGYATQEPGVLILADPDVVDITNLNRQAFTQYDIGKNKAVALKSNILPININVRAEAVTEGITRDNVPELVSSSDAIVDMIDVGRPDIMLALHREAQRQKKPVISGFDLGEGTTTIVYDYRNPRAMTLDRLLGLENVSLDEIAQFTPVARTAIAAQCLLGSVEKFMVNTGSVDVAANGMVSSDKIGFATSDEAKKYYTDFFASKSRADALKEEMPEEMGTVIDKLISGELDFIPQMNTASITLGNVHEAILRRLLVGQRVRTAPDVIKTDMRVLIEPDVSSQAKRKNKNKIFIGEEVGERNGSKTIACEVAVSDADRSQREVLVALAFIKQGYIRPDDQHIDDNGAYVDESEWHAVPIVAKKGPHVVGSIRLIPRVPGSELPIRKPDYEGNFVEIDPEYQKLVDSAPFEVSQLARLPDTGELLTKDEEVNILPAVLRGFIAHLQQVEASYAVAVIDERVRKLLNWPQYRFGLPVIGPTKFYMGSLSTPVLVNVEDIIKNTKKARSQGFSDFLSRGQGVPGYEWYQGI